MAKSLAELEAELKDLGIKRVKVKFASKRWTITDGATGDEGSGDTLEEAFRDFIEGEDESGNESDDDSDDDSDEDEE